MNRFLFVLRRVGFGIVVLLPTFLLHAHSNSALAATILIDDFPGTGGIPSGWSLVVGTGTISHSGSIVTINNDGGATPTNIGHDATLFNPQGTTTVFVTEIVSIDGEGGGSILGFGGTFLGVRLEGDGTLQAFMGLSPAPEDLTRFFFPTVSGYSGGAIDMTLFMDTAGFRVSTDTGYDSGAVTWATASGGVFDLSTLGPAVRPGITAALAPSLLGEISFDRVMVSTVPIPAAVWLFGSALGLLGWMRRKAA
jgi:hypothetical protein